ncbi:hypothetical protein [Metabacillus fastidiosus]|uniref:hypothetical protein n=1 Tax=Metabacillus fastidiosus TaxID=1458 RepID=UPI002DBF28A2|nr:hypothetical protein [Metabacillus fastidiosus]MEC2077790.1 hypothetical protein [Metabacillus fastidiosus]
MSTIQDKVVVIMGASSGIVSPKLWNSKGIQVRIISLINKFKITMDTLTASLTTSIVTFIEQAEELREFLF